VRALAAEFGLAVAAKPDSQDICFVPQGRYVDVVKKLRPDAETPGEIVHLDGRVLGVHKGIVHYTVGQRKGLEIGGLAEPLYVVAVDAARHRVIVGPRLALACASAAVREVNWLGDAPSSEGVPVQVRVRSTTRPTPARFMPGPNPHVVFETPEYGVSPGQAAVFYAGGRVLGGGWIAGTTRALHAAQTAA